MTLANANSPAEPAPAPATAEVPPTLANMLTAINDQLHVLHMLQQKRAHETDKVRRWHREAHRLESVERILQGLEHLMGHTLTADEILGVMRELLQVPRGPVLVAALHKIRAANESPSIQENTTP